MKYANKNDDLQSHLSNLLSISRFTNHLIFSLMIVFGVNRLVYPCHTYSRPYYRCLSDHQAHRFNPMMRYR